MALCSIWNECYPVSSGSTVDATGNESLTRQIQAATFRQLVAHFQANPQASNPEMMNLSGFCRNCVAKWYMQAAHDAGEAVDTDAAREVVYGMPYEQWKKQYAQARILGILYCLLLMFAIFFD